MLVKTKTAIGPSTTKYSKITNNLNEKNYIMTNIRENLSLLKSGLVDRQMAQQLRACSVLAENPSSVPRTHSEQFSSRDSRAFFWLLQDLHAHALTQRQTCIPII